MTDFSYEDVLEAQKTLVESGRKPVRAELTEDQLESLKQDATVVASDLEDNRDFVARLNSVDVFETDDESVVIAEDGTEKQIE